MNYNPSILQRDRSRVPYNANVVADTNNPAWTWADGVLDKIIETSHSRGYFSGDNFILGASQHHQRKWLLQHVPSRWNLSL